MDAITAWIRGGEGKKVGTGAIVGAAATWVILGFRPLPMVIGAGVGAGIGHYLGDKIAGMLPKVSA